MDLTKLSRVVAGLVAAAGMPVALAFPAFADCGDPGQPACMGPVPTVDQVVAIMAELTDPDIPASNKTVTSSQRSLTAAASEARSAAAQNPLHSVILSRPGISGDSRSWEDSSYGPSEQVPR